CVLSTRARRPASPPRLPSTTLFRSVRGDELVDELPIADITHDQLHAVFGETCEVISVAGVGQFVQHRDLVIFRMLLDCLAYKVRTDKPGTTGHKQRSHGCNSTEQFAFVHAGMGTSGYWLLKVPEFCGGTTWTPFLSSNYKNSTQ